MKKRLLASVRTLAAVAWPLAGAGITTADAFTHPGIPLTVDDLNTLKANLNTEPWKSGYAALQADGRSSASYTMQGPFATVSRNDAGSYANEGAWKNDMQAIFNLSLMWQFTGNNAYAQKAHDILLAWATTQTAFTGVESSFDIGDYAYCYVGGADILRGTWPGWTASDTTTVQNFFSNVYWPNLSLPGPLTTGSQGMEPLLAATAIAVFNDDQTKLDQVVSALLRDGDAGLRDTLPNGQVGDTGRDQGHTSLFVNNLAFIGEILWKQGIDVFSIMDNRILAAGEYYARYNLPDTAPGFVSFGAPFWGTFPSISGAPRSTVQGRRALNLLHGAYAVRKGISAPWIQRYRVDQTEDGNSFLFLKSADSSTATPPTLPVYPAVATVTNGLTNADLNGSTPAGSGSYSGGTWTLGGGYNGVDIWGSSAPSVHFSYRAVTGDFTLLAKVTSVANVGSTSAKAGILLRDVATGTAARQVFVAITPNSTYERGMRGYTTLPYGSNAASLSFAVQSLPYWVKMERVGNRIQTFVSKDGGCWSPAGTADFSGMPSTVYAGLFGTSQVTGASSTSTFTNVCMTGGDGGQGAVTPASPSAIVTSPGHNQVTVRWTESFGATSYKVKRSTTSGSGYTTLATVGNTAYIDTTAANGTTYYYVVTAANAAGDSSNSPQDAALPIAAMTNVAVNGSATASANGGSGTEGAAKAFDGNPGSKWFNGNAGTTGWVQYDFGASLAQTVKRYGITSAGDVAGRDPAAWQFQGSNNGTTWTTLDTRSGQSFTYRYQTKSFDFTNTTAYRYYRLNVTANNGDATGLQVGEIALETNQGRTVPNGTYRLFNRKSNKALDVNGGSTADGTPAVQWGYDGGSDQKWTFTDQGNGQYQILGVASGKALEVMGNGTGDGPAIDIWPWNGGNNQKWTVTPAGDGFYRLTPMHATGKAADVSGASTADGASVIQWNYTGGTNQQWLISIAP
ncbi:RICIN domain-containing protein [Luteolibacter sp. LG18]|uniref:RICIN domain-containing protein n=1 Tax=Luteolibacter sp. LG18 TaxID=2819286 RepID=UPI002B3030DB|nr:hypothetical protein llg_45040 [Luteolibacter sp. LG18]